MVASSKITASRGYHLSTILAPGKCEERKRKGAPFVFCEKKEKRDKHCNSSIYPKVTDDESMIKEMMSFFGSLYKFVCSNVAPQQQLLF